MSWCCNVAMLCPNEIISEAAAGAAALSGNQNDNSPSFFSRKVGPIGSTISTHRLAHSRMRAVVLGALPDLLSIFPGAAYHVTQHDDIKEHLPTVEEWLSSLGLALIEEEEA